MNVNSSIQLAFEHYQQGNLQQAEDIFNNILKAHPHNYDALYYLGIISYQLKNYAAATYYFKEVVKYYSNNVYAYNDLGSILQERGLLEDAVDCYQKALQLNPNYADIYYNLGIIFKRKGQVDNAVTYYEKALQLNPSFTKVLVNLGIICQEKGQFDKAINYSQQALQIDPNYSAAYINLGNAYCEKGQINEAIISFQKAIELDRDNSVAHINLGFAFFSSGDLKRGWREYEWRWKSNEGMDLLRKYSQPMWTGFDISGCTILLHDEPKSQAGFGDAIQFIRYAPLIAKCGAKVIFECKKELVSLLKNVEGIYQIIELGEQPPFFDVHCFLLDLPFIFDISLDNIPSEIPYISVEPSLIRKWTEKVENNKDKFKVGLVWAAEGVERSCPIETFTVLGQITDSIIFYSLQKGEAENQTKDLPGNMQVVNLTEEINDFSDTAALIKNLDLVVSVDTAVAHLAGALGKPVWILVPFVAPWRWMFNREDSPWYPTMRLFRQPSLGDWEPVMAKVKDELLNLLDKN